MKKVISLLLALMLVFGLATTAFATATEGGATTANKSTLTINTAAGHTYLVYQLLTGDVSDLTNGAGTLSNIKAGTGLKVDTDDKTDEVADFLNAIKGKTGAALANAAHPFVDTAKDATYTVTGTGEPVAISTPVENGYYFVIDTWTNNVEVEDDVLSRYMIAVVGNTTMKPKTDKPSIDKKIIDTDANVAIDTNKKTDTAAIGDTIEYEITGKVPNTEGYTYYYYVVHDTMSKGLTLVEDSFEVTVGTKKLDQGNETDPKDYCVYITKNDDGTTTFKLAFVDMKKLVDDKTISVGDAISIKYEATVNDQAEIGTNPNTNTAKLEYSNNPGSSEGPDKDDKPGIPGEGDATGEGPNKETKTYVTELIINKVDDKGNVLTGAEFTLTGTNLNKVIVKTNYDFVEAAAGETATHYQLKDGTFTTKGPSDAQEGEDGFNSNLYVNPEKATHVLKATTSVTNEASTDKKVVAEVDENGRVTFTGLNAGEYTLSETKTPVGYNTIKDITFTITAAVGADNAFTWSVTGTDIVLDATNGVFNTVIENVPGTELPETGGIGTTLFYIIGGVLAAAAVVLLITKKRMASEY